MSFYLRIEKSTNIDIPEGMTYQQAIDYAHQADAEGFLDFDLLIDVMDEGGEVVNEAGWDECVAEQADDHDTEDRNPNRNGVEPCAT